MYRGADSPGALLERCAMSEYIWTPTPELVRNANVSRFMRRHGIATAEELRIRAAADIEWFWQAALEDLGLEWSRPFERCLDMSRGFPFARWFAGGRINITWNCLDRHVRNGRGSTVAVSWENEDGELKELTYRRLHSDVCRLAAVLTGFGVRRGDAVALYMPMIPEVVTVMFACFRIGAVAVPIFSGFGVDAVVARLVDSAARVVVTADGGRRRGKSIAVKKFIDQACEAVRSVERVLVVRHTGIDMAWNPARDVLWEDALGAAAPMTEIVDTEAEDRALIIYTSGTTGKPKGTVHTHAGCLAQMTKEIAYYMDYQSARGDLFFWLTDIGWMMGPWEIIGVSALGGRFGIYEGVPNYPGADRLWDLVQRHRITHLGISPTAIRLLMRAGDHATEAHDLSSLRILGSTGEPWDPTSWMWYFEKVGGRRCPVINISGGTEIVGCHLSPLPISPLKPCTLGGPGLGMDVDVVDDEGRPVRGRIGYLVCRKPAPSMTKGFLNDDERYLETYFSRFPGIWYHGDLAMIDEDGFWFLFGRADDTIKVAGKRMGPGEIEAALISHEAVSEAAAVGVPHDVKGETVVCFVVLKPGRDAGGDLRTILRALVAEKLGGSFRPREVHVVTALPKTRSAKIVRGLIRRKYLGEPIGDLGSVENPEALDAIPRAGGEPESDA